MFFFFQGKMTGALGFKKSQAMGEDTSIRLCDHCYRLLESRQTYQERMQTEKEVTKMYQKLQELITKAKPLVVLFNKVEIMTLTLISVWRLP